MSNKAKHFLSAVSSSYDAETAYGLSVLFRSEYKVPEEGELKMTEKRKDSRLYSHEVMEYRLSDREPGDSFIGVTNDLSKSGACLYLLDKVSVGDRITLMYKMASFQENAVVKWVRKVQDEIYIAGMMFERS